MMDGLPRFDGHGVVEEGDRKRDFGSADDPMLGIQHIPEKSAARVSGMFISRDRDVVDGRVKN